MKRKLAIERLEKSEKICKSREKKVLKIERFQDIPKKSENDAVHFLDFSKWLEETC